MSSRKLSPRVLSAVVLAVGIAAHVGLQLVPAWQKVVGAPSGRDFASYYYAARVAQAGGDPYDVRALSGLARTERSRGMVQPYFYPPPFLLSMLWAPAFPLADAYRIMLVANEVLLGGCLILLHRFFAIAPWALALLLATYTPIPDNAWMGQANLLVLLPALLGLGVAARRPYLAGGLVGLAAMFKMSPALFLLYWALRENWRAVAAAMATAVALTLLSLPLVALPLQIHFYQDVLPGFARGDYHGLTVALNIPGNHSIPEIFNQWWPGATPTSMSERALQWSRGATLTLLGGWAWWFRKPGDLRKEGLALGSLTILMTIVPAYTYEHHLVFLLLPIAAVASASHGPWRLAFAASYFFLAWPLTWLNAARGRWPAAEELFRESKFLALLAFLVLSAALTASYRAATRSPSANL